MRKVWRGHSGTPEEWLLLGPLSNAVETGNGKAEQGSHSRAQISCALLASDAAVLMHICGSDAAIVLGKAVCAVNATPG